MLSISAEGNDLEIKVLVSALARARLRCRDDAEATTSSTVASSLALSISDLANDPFRRRTATAMVTASRSVLMRRNKKKSQS
jgi:hypothetical protein